MCVVLLSCSVVYKDFTFSFEVVDSPLASTLSAFERDFERLYVVVQATQVNDNALAIFRVLHPSAQDNRFAISNHLFRFAVRLAEDVLESLSIVGLDKAFVRDPAHYIPAPGHSVFEMRTVLPHSQGASTLEQGATVYEAHDLESI